MIDLIGVVIVIIIQIFITYYLIKIQKEKYENEILSRDKTVSTFMQKIKEKNIKIKELENEIQRRNNSRL